MLGGWAREGSLEQKSLEHTALNNDLPCSVCFFSVPDILLSVYIGNIEKWGPVIRKHWRGARPCKRERLRGYRAVLLANRSYSIHNIAQNHNLFEPHIDFLSYVSFFTSQKAFWFWMVTHCVELFWQIWWGFAIAIWESFLSLCQQVDKYTVFCRVSTSKY